MTVRITIGSVRGGSGATTTSLLVARCLADALVVEADPHGGTIATTFGLGREPGLTTFASRAPSPSLWRSHAQAAGGVPVLVGPDSPTAASALWRGAGDRLERNLSASEVGTTILDAGRIDVLAPLLARADLVVLLVRPVAEELVTLTHVLPPLVESEPKGRVALVAVGEGPYALSEVGLGTEVIAQLPQDPIGAAALLGGHRRRAVRCPLGRAIAGLADTAARAARVRRTFAVGAAR